MADRTLTPAQIRAVDVLFRAMLRSAPRVSPARDTFRESTARSLVRAGLAFETQILAPGSSRTLYRFSYRLSSKGIKEWHALAQQGLVNVD